MSVGLFMIGDDVLDDDLNNGVVIGISCVDGFNACWNDYKVIHHTYTVDFGGYIRSNIKECDLTMYIKSSNMNTNKEAYELFHSVYEREKKLSDKKVFKGKNSKITIHKLSEKTLHQELTELFNKYAESGLIIDYIDFDYINTIGGSSQFIGLSCNTKSLGQ